jgi:hypothetical protein
MGCTFSSNSHVPNNYHTPNFFAQIVFDKDGEIDDHPCHLFSVFASPSPCYLLRMLFAYLMH